MMYKHDQQQLYQNPDPKQVLFSLKDILHYFQQDELQFILKNTKNLEVNYGVFDRYDSFILAFNETPNIL